MSLRAAQAAGLALLCAIFATAAEFWETKQFTSWTERECRQLLDRSPWAFSNAFGDDPAPAERDLRNIPGDPAVRPEAPPATFDASQKTILFEFRLLSALPVRMALARLRLLQSPADAALREQVLAGLNTPPGKDIVVQVSYRTVPPDSSSTDDIHEFFLHADLATFKTNTYLEGGERKEIALTGYLPPNAVRSNAAFVFPRLHGSGVPNFTGDEKSITMRSEFTPEMGGTKRKFGIFVKMAPADMRFHGAFTI